MSKGALRQLSFDEVAVNIEHSPERQEVGGQTRKAEDHFQKDEDVELNHAI